MSNKKTLKSSFNIFASGTLLLGSVLSIISTSYIIKIFGSDLNGIIATVSQIIILITVFEGGFTISICSALYKPFMDCDLKKVFGILSASSNIFKIIGIVIFIFTLLISIGYSYFISTHISKVILYYIFFTTGLTTITFIFYELKYKIMFQVAQKEYITILISSLIEFISQALYIFFIIQTENIFIIRASLLMMAILRAFIVFRVFRIYFKNYKFNAPPDYSVIKDTKHVFVQKIAGMLYTTSPLIIVSFFINTSAASIYFVYMSIFTILKNVIISFVLAPVNGFGQMLSLNKSSKEEAIFLQYEFIIGFILCFSLCTISILIKSFLIIYSKDFHDVNYVDPGLIFLFILLAFTEIIHLPSGAIINVTGNFKLTRNAFILFSIVNILLAVILVKKIGIYGVLIAGIFSNLVLGAIEIYYAHKVIFKSSLTIFFKITIPPLFAVLLFAGISFKYNFIFETYFNLIRWSFVAILFVLITQLFINYIFLKKYLLYTIDIINGLLKNINYKK